MYIVYGKHCGHTYSVTHPLAHYSVRIVYTITHLNSVEPYTLRELFLHKSLHKPVQLIYATSSKTMLFCKI